MKYLYLISGLVLLGFCIVSCNTFKNIDETMQNSQKEISITGVVREIKNGKDGYVAFIKGDDYRNYIATISTVNLRNNASQFKSPVTGDKITVRGSYWKDDKGETNITVRELK